jgi:hypothetical protein
MRAKEFVRQSTKDGLGWLIARCCTYRPANQFKNILVAGTAALLFAFALAIPGCSRPAEPRTNGSSVQAPASARAPQSARDATATATATEVARTEEASTQKPSESASRQQQLDDENARRIAAAMSQPWKADGRQADPPTEDTQLNAPSGDLADAARAQQQILDVQRQQADQQRDIKAIQRRLKDRTSALFVRLYEAAKKSGVRFSPVSAEIAEQNVFRRQTGVWEMRIGKSLDGNTFVTVWDFMEEEPTFAVLGVGMFTARAYLRDAQFESTGRFAKECRYEINVGSDKRRYPCQEFLDGNLDTLVFEDMKHDFASSLARR